MKAICTVKDTNKIETELAVGGSRGWVRVTMFLPDESIISLTPTQAIKVARDLIDVAWDQRDKA